MRPDYFRAPPPTNALRLSGLRGLSATCPFSHAHQRGREDRTPTQWSTQQTDLCALSIESVSKSAATQHRSTTNPQQHTRGAKRPSMARGTAARIRRGLTPAPQKTAATNPPARHVAAALASLGCQGSRSLRRALRALTRSALSCPGAGLSEGFIAPSVAPSGYRPASGAFP